VQETSPPTRCSPPSHKGDNSSWNNFIPLRSLPWPQSDPACRHGRPFECIALLLQGGGALGSYQAGVYAALAEAELQPDARWQDLITPFWRKLLHPHRPDLYYMRGPGPKWREKHLHKTAR
jgi:hypothetical protein